MNFTRFLLINKGVVYNFTGFRVSGVVLRKVPEDAGVLLIEAVWQKFGDVQPLLVAEISSAMNFGLPFYQIG